MDVLNPIPPAAGGPVTPLAPRPKDLRGRSGRARGHDEDRGV